MEMKKLSGGNLRAAGYDDRRRVLVVELTVGNVRVRGRLRRNVSPDGIGVVAVELFPRQHRRGVSGEARALTRARARAHAERDPRAAPTARVRPRYWIVSLRPASAAFLDSVSSSTPFSYFAALVASSSSTGSVKLR